MWGDMQVPTLEGSLPKKRNQKQKNQKQIIIIINKRGSSHRSTGVVLKLRPQTNQIYAVGFYLLKR